MSYFFYFKGEIAVTEYIDFKTILSLIVSKANLQVLRLYRQLCLNIIEQ